MLRDPGSLAPGPKDLRTLTLKNIDNKFEAGGVKSYFASATQNRAMKLQRGFMNNRQSVHNVVDLDYDTCFPVCSTCVDAVDRLLHGVLEWT